MGKIGSEKAVDAIIPVLNDKEEGVRKSVVETLGEIGSLTCLAGLIQFSQLNVYRPDIFLLARTLAVRFSKVDLPFIPMYPEWVKAARPANRAEG